MPRTAGVLALSWPGGPKPPQISAMQPIAPKRRTDDLIGICSPQNVSLTPNCTLRAVRAPVMRPKSGAPAVLTTALVQPAEVLQDGLVEFSRFSVSRDPIKR